MDGRGGKSGSRVEQTKEGAHKDMRYGQKDTNHPEQGQAKTQTSVGEIICMYGPTSWIGARRSSQRKSTFT